MKERIRATHQILPFKALPRAMVKHMVVEVVKKLNCFPQSGGISGCSPRTMLGEPPLDHQKHCQFVFGGHVTAPHEDTPCNTMATRAVDCLCIGPRASAHGGHILCHIPTGKTITRQGAIKAAPMPQAVIDAINSRAEAEHMPSLKIQSKHLTPEAWLAEVDQQGQDPEDSEDQDDEAEHSSDEDSDDESTTPTAVTTDSESDSYD